MSEFVGEFVLDEADEFFGDEAAALGAVPPGPDFAIGIGAAGPVNIDHHVGERFQLVFQERDRALQMEIARYDDNVETSRCVLAANTGQDFESILHILEGVGRFSFDDDVVFGDTVVHEFFFKYFRFGEVAAGRERTDATRDDDLVGNSPFIEIHADFNAVRGAAENERVSLKMGGFVVGEALSFAHEHGVRVTALQRTWADADQEFQDIVGDSIEWQTYSLLSRDGKELIYTYIIA